jgi:hypothetical protein
VDSGDRTFDAIIAGTTWHWVDPAPGSRKAAELLRLDQVPTFGGHSQFPPAKLEELLTGIGAAIDTIGGDSRAVSGSASGDEAYCESFYQRADAVEVSIAGPQLSAAALSGDGDLEVSEWQRLAAIAQLRSK